MRNFSALTILAGGLCASALAAEAQTLKDGPMVNYMLGGDVETDDLGFGYQVVYEFSRNNSIELSGSWNEDTSLDLGSRIPTFPAASHVDMDVFSIALTGRLGYAPNPNVIAYLGGGIGYYILKVNNENLLRDIAPDTVGFIEAEADKDFGAHFALGVEVVMWRHWEMFAEWRQVFYDTQMQVSYAATPSTPLVESRDDFSYDHALLRIGLNYRF